MFASVTTMAVAFALPGAAWATGEFVPSTGDTAPAVAESDTAPVVETSPAPSTDTSAAPSTDAPATAPDTSTDTSAAPSTDAPATAPDTSSNEPDGDSTVPDTGCVSDCEVETCATNPDGPGCSAELPCEANPAAVECLPETTCADTPAAPECQPDAPDCRDTLNAPECAPDAPGCEEAPTAPACNTPPPIACQVAVECDTPVCVDDAATPGDDCAPVEGGGRRPGTPPTGELPFTGIGGVFTALLLATIAIMGAMIAHLTAAKREFEMTMGAMLADGDLEFTAGADS